MSRRVRLRQPIPATRDALWEACASQEGLELWQADEVHGTLAVDSEVTLSWPELGLGLALRVLEVHPKQRIVFGAGGTTLTLTVEEQALVLSHEGLRTEDEEQGMASAWQISLALLGYALSCYPARPRRARWLMRPLPASALLCHYYFTDRRGLAAWLTEEGEIGEVGSRCVLRLGAHRIIEGPVLAHVPGRDLAVGWENQASCLVLRTFPALHSNQERLAALCWSRWDDQAFDPAWLGHFERALTRLEQRLTARGQA